MKKLQLLAFTLLLILFGNTASAQCDAFYGYATSAFGVTFYDSSYSVNGHQASWYIDNQLYFTGSSFTYVDSSGRGYIDVCLVIYDSIANCTDSTCGRITFGGTNPSCNPTFTKVQDSSNVRKYYFYGSNPPNGYTVVYWVAEYNGNTWNGSATYTTQNATHTFASNTTQGIVTYGMYDAAGNFCDSSYTTINFSGTGTSCNATFTYSIDSANPMKYYFNGSTPSSGNTVQWAVYEQTSNGSNTTNYTTQNMTHTFSSSTQTSTVAYLMFDSAGNFCDSSWTSLRFTGTGAGCQASFYVALDTTAQYTLYIVNSSTGTSSNTSYTWSFGDGTTSTSSNPTHSYNSFGLFNVCLTITDSNCTSTYCDSVGLDSNGNLLKAEGFQVIVVNEGDLLSVPDVKMQDVALYPNPTQGNVTLRWNANTAGTVKTTLLNTYGREIEIQEFDAYSGANEVQLDLSSLADGMYFVRLEQGDASLIRKLVLKR